MKGGIDMDEMLDRYFVRGMQTGYKYGYDVGYMEGKYAYAILSDKQREDLNKDIEGKLRQFQLCITTRLDEIRKAKEG